MFDNEIISPNEKVKKIRKQILRTTIKEIANGVCTTVNISNIENNKQSLTHQIAAGIAKNFNDIAESKGIKIEPITAEWLMKDEDTQANDIFEINIFNVMKEIKEVYLFEEKIIEAEGLIENCNISDNNKIQFYLLASSFYYSKHIYTKSDEMCDYGLKICLNSHNLLCEAHLYVNKSRNNTRKSKYTEALEQLDHAEKISRNLNDDELFERIYFNKALTYKKIETYGESIKYLKILRDKFKIKDEKKLIGIKMLLANCFNEQHEFENAEKEYISILEPAMKLNDKDFVAQAYRNLSELYFNQENYKDAAVYIKESLKNNTGNGHLAENLTFAAKVVKNINEDPEIYLLQALDICEKKDKENLNLIENIIYELVLVYKDREDEDNLDIMINKTEELNIEYDLIFPVLVEYYRYTNEEKSKKLNRKQIDKTIIRKKF